MVLPYASMPFLDVKQQLPALVCLLMCPHMSYYFCPMLSPHADPHISTFPPPMLPLPPLRALTGEFEPHTGCWMGWPDDPCLWRDNAKPAQQQYAAVAKTISQFEPVTMFANKEVRSRCLRHDWQPAAGRLLFWSKPLPIVGWPTH